MPVDVPALFDLMLLKSLKVKNMRSLSFVALLTVLALLLVCGLAGADPWSVTYTGNVGTPGYDNEWDLSWIITWAPDNTPAEGVSFVWFDVPESLQSADVTSWTDGSTTDFITTSGLHYYVGVASDPYGVTEGDKVFLWAISSNSDHLTLTAVVVNPDSYTFGTIDGGIGGSNLIPGGSYSDFSTLGLTPEPGSLALLLFGLGALGLRHRRKQ